eukprot:9330602-Alexandrium_andersonii.AAC.1
MEATLTDFKDTMLWTFERCKEQAPRIGVADLRVLLICTFENCRGQVSDVGESLRHSLFALHLLSCGVPC